MNELMTHENEWVLRFDRSLDRMLAALNRLGKESRPLLNGERYLTDKEVGARLKVSRRTLQNYRNAGRIPYILLGGKLLYRESDIERRLMEGDRPAAVRM